MYNECRHILPSGKKCQSPALQNQAYCYYHNNLRRSNSPVPHNNPTLPSIEDHRGIQIALTQVLNSLNSPYMDTRRAGLLLYGLQIATQLANRTSDLKPNEAVRTCDETTEAATGPEKTVCEPPHDCLACPKRQTCIVYEDNAEVKQEEEQEEDAEDSLQEHATGDDQSSQDRISEGALEGGRGQSPDEDPNATYRRKDDAAMLRGALRLFRMANNSPADHSKKGHSSRPRTNSA